MSVASRVRTDWQEIFASTHSFDEASLPITGFPIVDTFEGEVVDPQSLHKYLYCRDDGVNFTDPTGRTAIFWLLGSMLSTPVTAAMIVEQAAFTVAKGIAITVALQAGKPAAQMRQDGIDLMAIHGGNDKYYNLAFRLYNAGALGVAESCQNAILAYYGVELIECAWNAISLVRNLKHLSDAARNIETTTVVVSTTSLTYATLNFTTGNSRTMFVSLRWSATVDVYSIVTGTLEAAHALGEATLSTVQFLSGIKGLWDSREQIQKSREARRAIVDFRERYPGQWRFGAAEHDDAMLVLSRVRD